MFISFSKFLGNSGIRVGLGVKTGGGRKKKSASASLFSAIGIFFVVMFQIMLYTVLFTGWCCYAVVYGIIFVIKSIVSMNGKKQPSSDKLTSPGSSEPPAPKQPNDKKPIFDDRDQKVLLTIVVILCIIAFSALISKFSGDAAETTTERPGIETTETSTFKTNATSTTKQTTSRTTRATTSASKTETTERTTETTPITTETTLSTIVETTTKETTAKTETTEREHDYVLNTNSGIFHNPSCRHASRISESNRSEYHGTRSSVISKGYSPCGVCHP